MQPNRYPSASQDLSPANAFVLLRKSIFDVAEKFRFLSDGDYLALGRVFKPDQPHMIEQVRADSLVDITEVWRAPNGGCAQPKGRRCTFTVG
jgi:hypothetical protein